MALKRAAAFAAIVLMARPATAGDLFPFTMPWNDTGNGGVTDLSSWNDKPAGARGFVTVEGGHLKAGGQRLQLLGVNVVFGSSAPSHEDADAIARRLARFGVNIVRFHHMDTVPIPNGILQNDRRTLDPATLDRLDYFVAALKREGIYSDINLHVGREYPGMGEIWPGGPSYWKGVDLFYPQMIALEKDYARDLLTHRNPYTGTSYVEEPAVAIVEINNENGLLNEWETGSLDGMTGPFRSELARQWQAWLKQRYGNDAALRAAWGSREEALGPEMLTPVLGPNQPGWELQTIGSAKARMVAVPGGIAVGLLETGQESWHTQLHQNGLSITADRPYTLTMMVHADRPMTIDVQVMQAHAPWTSLWSDTIQVGIEWQTVTLVFAPAAGDTQARLTLGGLGFQVGRLGIALASLKPGGTVGLKPGENLDRGTIDIIDHSGRFGRTAAAQRDWLNFLWDVEDGYWREMQRYLKADLGVRSPVVGTQVSYSPAAIQSALDVVDGHAYWQHPWFPGKAWDMSNWQIQNSPMAGVEGAGTIAELALRRVPGKPYIVTEYNLPAPSFYQGEAMPLIAAYGALQNWDGLFLFCFGGWDSNWHTDHIGEFFDSRSNPVKMASLITTAALLRRGDVTAASPGVSTMPARSEWIEALRRAPSMPGGDSFGAPRETALARSVSAATPGGQPPARPVVSETGELSWGLDGVGGKTVVIDSRRSKGLIGARLGRAYDAHGVVLELTEARNDWGVLLATVIQGMDFSSPGRILVTLLGQEENTGQQWLNGQKATVGNQWGRTPVLVEGLGARLTLPVPAGRVSAWALDELGNRKTALPVGGTVQATVELGEQYRTLWYEIDIQ